MTMWRGAPTWLKIVAGFVALTALVLVLNSVVGARLVRPSGDVVDERWTPASPDEPPPALPSLTLDDARALDGRPFTVDGGAGWRGGVRAPPGPGRRPPGAPPPPPGAPPPG